MKRTLAVAVAVTLCGPALAACTTPVSGHGSIDRNVAAPSAGASDGQSDGNTGGAGGSRLSCGGGTVISPKGAPYCYLLPAGLGQITNITLPGGGDHTSAVGIGGRDVIAVTVFQTPGNTDELSDDELRADTDQVVAQQLSDDFAFASKVGEALTVDGARTVHYQARGRQEAFDIDIYFVYRGTAKMQINCQSQDHRQQIDSGCHDLLRSLQFRPPR
jgi:hypothetical protein